MELAGFLGGYVKIAGMIDESMDKEQMKTASRVGVGQSQLGKDLS